MPASTGEVAVWVGLKERLRAGEPIEIQVGRDRGQVAVKPTREADAELRRRLIEDCEARIAELAGAATPPPEERNHGRSG